MLTRLNPPINTREHFNLSCILLILGFLLTCGFLLIEQRKITRELLLATFSSIYLGLGFFFMMLNFGLNL